MQKDRKPYLRFVLFKEDAMNVLQDGPWNVSQFFRVDVDIEHRIRSLLV